jgi:hypothetical protein
MSTTLEYEPIVALGNSPQTNAICSISISASAKISRQVLAVAASYNIAPTATDAVLAVTVNGATVFIVDVNLNTPPILDLRGLIPTKKNQIVAVTLAAGGATVIGHLALFYYDEEYA